MGSTPNCGSKLNDMSKYKKVTIDFKNMTEDEKRAYHREYYRKNKGKRKETMNKYYHSHKEEYKERREKLDNGNIIEWDFVGKKDHKFLCKMLKIQP